MAVSLLKKHEIEFVRPGLSMSEVIDKKIQEHAAEVSHNISVMSVESNECVKYLTLF